MFMTLECSECNFTDEFEADDIRGMRWICPECGKDGYCFVCNKPCDDDMLCECTRPD